MWLMHTQQQQHDQGNETIGSQHTPHDLIIWLTLPQVNAKRLGFVRLPLFIISSLVWQAAKTHLNFVNSFAYCLTSLLHEYFDKYNSDFLFALLLSYFLKNNCDYGHKPD